MKILFVTSNRLGDAVLSTGLLHWLVTNTKNPQITVACGPSAAGIFWAMPGLENLLVVRKAPWNLHWLALWSVCIEARWDLIVDLRNSAMTRFLRAGRRVYRTGRGGRHKVIENAAVLDLKPPPAPYIYVSDEARTEAVPFLPPERPFLALAPAANWAAKQWPAASFIALAERLTGADGPLPGAPVVIAAAENERGLVQPILDALGSRAFPVLGQDLLIVAACFEQAALFVGNDSGLMHMAAAVGAPVLGLFGPGFEKIYGPWGPRAAVVRTPETRAELMAKLSQGEGPLSSLMETLSVDKVFAVATQLLADTVPQKNPEIV